MFSRVTLTVIIIAVLAIALVIFLFVSRKTKNVHIVEVSQAEQPRVILIDAMTEYQLKDAIAVFVKMYSPSGEVEIPNVLKEGEGYRLTFSSHVDFELFCWWVNYLVFSDKSRQEIYSVRGWYPFGEVTLDGQSHEFSGQTIFLYIPKDDELYDDIFMITPEGKHYQWEFGRDIRAIAPRNEHYQPLQNSL